MRKMKFFVVCAGVGVWLLAASLVLTVLFATHIRASTRGQEQPTLPLQAIPLGQSILSNGYELTFISLKPFVPAPDPSIATPTPLAGMRWIELDLSVVNKTGQEQTLSSGIMFNLRDEQGDTCVQEWLGSANAPQHLDGTLLAGEGLRGGIVFAIPQDEHTLTFGFEPVVGQRTAWTVSIT